METQRAPIVTILGHVDHGKTSLLDFIRKANVASKEHGGITQQIGAYQAFHDNKPITFIDTPGHAAFEKMRSRGASVADIAVLVVAADDGIMPQTVEAIKHILTAKVAMIVAVNKIDIPGIDLRVQMEKIKKQLSDRSVLVEEYGGNVPIVQLSAKTGVGVDKLLEMILLVSEMNEIKGDPSLPASGVVIESSLDKFKGPVATILIRNGTLKKGDYILLSGVKSKVRGLIDYIGNQLEQAGPSTPVEVLGLEIVPPVGAALGEEAKKAEQKSQIQSLVEKLRQQDEKLNVVVKADKQGSLEAIEDALQVFNKEKMMVDVALSGVGDISESDVKLASGVKAIVVGFNVKVAQTANRIAEEEHVLIRTYNIIYELLDELQDVIEGMIRPGKIEDILGRAEVIAEFPYGKNERIAGCRVLEGAINKGPRIKVVRNKDEVIGEGKIKSLKKVREEVNRIEKGSDCGIIFDSDIAFQVGDEVLSYRII